MAPETEELIRRYQEQVLEAEQQRSFAVVRIRDLEAEVARKNAGLTRALALLTSCDRDVLRRTLTDTLNPTRTQEIRS